MKEGRFRKKKFWPNRLVQKYSPTSITQFKFRILTWSSSIFINKPAIRIFILWVLVQGFHVRVSWCWIKIVIAFLHIFAMVSFKNSNLIIDLSEMISEKLKSLKSKLWLLFDLATWLCPYFQRKMDRKYRRRRQLQVPLFMPYTYF